MIVPGIAERPVSGSALRRSLDAWLTDETQFAVAAIDFAEATVRFVRISVSGRLRSELPLSTRFHL
ncbi:MAG: hypothetical protein ACPGVJ_00745 [Mangrovicoccus sp.]